MCLLESLAPHQVLLHPPLELLAPPQDSLDSPLMPPVLPRESLDPLLKHPDFCLELAARDLLSRPLELLGRLLEMRACP